MKRTDKLVTIRRYEDRLVKFGKSVKTMGWRDREQQWLRFKILTEIADLRSKKILDVGCGFGDLYTFLREKKIKVDYSGYDISPMIISEAKKIRPPLHFEIKDILVNPVKRRFDYAFSSGVFNHRISNNLEFTRSMIKKMFEISRRGVAVNMMTDYVDYKESHLFYYSPENIFRLAKSLTRHVVLRHDYPLYEFTLYLYRTL